jgi:hypothetical protein
MAFAYLTFTQAVAILANRLQDPNLTYWDQPNELENCIIESLRLFQAATGSYKQQVSFPTASNVNYYDLPTLTGSAAISYNATDVEVVNNVLAALLEPPITYPAWTGTGQFTLAQLQASMQNRLNRFIGETGCIVSDAVITDTTPTELITLPDPVLDVRRVGWVVPASGGSWEDQTQQWQQSNFSWAAGSGGTPAGLYPLGRVDEWAEQAYDPGAEQNPTNPPSCYSVYATGPLQLRLVPPPSAPGSVDCLLVQAGPTLNLNPGAPVVLSIPDDLSPAIKWGVLSDLLSSDGQARDPVRAAYCEQRWKEFVQLATLYPSVLTASIGNVTCGLGSVEDLDQYNPTWQQTVTAPDFVGMCGRNMACVGPVPDGVYSVALWMVANAPVTGTYLQVSRDQIDPVIDYAMHTACFKMGGREFASTEKMFDNLIQCATAQNARLSAVAFYRSQMEQFAAKSELDEPRLLRNQ